RFHGDNVRQRAGACAGIDGNGMISTMEPRMTPETARPLIDIHPPVAEALASGRPVVALESTIITHGMPYPDNAAMAANVEQIITESSAVPATIAVVNGRIKVGLSDGERENLAVTGDA